MLQSFTQPDWELWHDFCAVQSSWWYGERDTDQDKGGQGSGLKGDIGNLNFPKVLYTSLL